MHCKLLLIPAVAIAFSSVAFADIIISFSSPVSTVSFYSSEPSDLTATTNGTSALSITVNSGYTLGAVTPFADTNVTNVDFSGSPDYYIIDDFTYGVAGVTYVLNFDDPLLSEDLPVGSFYAGLPGGPVFSLNSVILTYPDYNYSGYPPESSPSVIYESEIQSSPVPEPASLLLLGTGLGAIGFAAWRKRK